MIQVIYCQVWKRFSQMKNIARKPKVILIQIFRFRIHVIKAPKGNAMMAYDCIMDRCPRLPPYHQVVQEETISRLMAKKRNAAQKIFLLRLNKNMKPINEKAIIGA